MLRINPHQSALWRDLKTLQIGAGADRVIFNSLTPAQERLVAALYRGIADKRLPGLLDELGVPTGEGQELVDALRPVLLKDSKPARISLSEDYVAGAFAEIIRASLLNSADGAAVLMERRHRTIHVDDLAPAGLALTLGLASAGIGRVVSHDLSVVEAKDLGPSAYPSQLLGRPKIEAIKSLLASSPNQMTMIEGSRLSELNLQGIDVAVVVGQQALEPRRYTQWLNRDIPHLAICFETDFASVSPMIVPGRGPCLFCLEQARISQDQSWPVLVSQLVTSADRLDDSSSRLFCAGIAIQKILGQVDELADFRQTDRELVGYRLETKSGSILEFRWPEHDACGCRLTSS